jgi:60 kDa SS-A/Ro ribonucleoprotein
MANKSLFAAIAGRLLPRADARNEAGGPAFARPPRQALAHYAATGCLNGTYYASAETQLAAILAVADPCSPEFVAKTAVWARQHAAMKDVPALLAAWLAARDGELLARVFDRVIDNSKMLRNFVQIIRSGVCGRKSLGTRPRRLVRQWLAARDASQIFRAAVGQSPSFTDIVRMVHPKPDTPEKSALFAWLCGRPHDAAALPAIVQHLERFSRGETREVPDVPFELLTALPLDAAAWSSIARHASWQMTRMNLNTFARHGVFAEPELVDLVAARLADRELVKSSRAFPYQLMIAYRNASPDVPAPIRAALHDAMEHATDNVPALPGQVHVLVDVSGSMQSPVTGHRRGATTAARCVDVAALVAATILRRNPTARVVPFHDRVVDVALEPRDTIVTNAERLAALPSGGTDCSAPLRQINAQRAPGDLVIFVSDNQSWVDAAHGHGATATLREWQTFQKRNPGAKLVCIDLQPYGTTQAPERQDILNVGGFSDRVFEVVRAFTDATLTPDHLVGVIEAIAI